MATAVREDEHNNLIAATNEEHAHLIAAAPDILDCLRLAVARVELANQEGSPIMSAWLIDARAAIAKAEGEEPRVDRAKLARIVAGRE